MKTAMLTADENGIPQETLAAIRNGGIEITCRKCLTEAELIEFAADADVLWMFGPNLALTAGALDHLPKCKALFRSGQRRGRPAPEACRRTRHRSSQHTGIHCGIRLRNMRSACCSQWRTQSWKATGTCRRGKWFDGLNCMRWHLTGRTLGWSATDASRAMSRQWYPASA